MMKNASLLLFALIAAAGMIACAPNPADCFDKGDEIACNKLCDSGGEEMRAACYEIRARATLACADGTGDCKDACGFWKNAQASSEDIKNFYVAKLGSEAKVAALTERCAAP